MDGYLTAGDRRLRPITSGSRCTTHVARPRSVVPGVVVARPRRVHGLGSIWRQHDNERPSGEAGAPDQDLLLLA